MKQLRVLPERPLAAVEEATPLDIDKGCSRCSLWRDKQSVCMNPEGEPGGVLFVGEAPSSADDRRGRPFMGASGRLLRHHAKQWWSGPIAIDNAVKCYPRGTPVEEKHIASCRPYLAQVVEDVEPSRIVALGTKAIHGLLGRSLPILSTRRGYGWLYNHGDPIPVFYVVHPAAALRNRFVKRWFARDIRWALTNEPPLPMQLDAMARVVETREDAEQAVAELREAPWSTFDCETAGEQYSDWFYVTMLAACAKGSRDAWVWDFDALNKPEVAAPLRAWLADPQCPKIGHHLKFDGTAVYCDPRIATWLAGWYGDTLLWRKMLTADADGRLEVMEELIGMGGHKAEIAEAIARAKRIIQKERKNNTMRLPGFDPILEAATVSKAEPVKFAYGMLPPELSARYCAGDAIATARLAERLEPGLEAEPDLHRMWETVVCGANEAVAQIQAWGIATSREGLEAYSTFLGARINDIEARMSHYAFNPASARSVGDLLFKQLKLKSTQETDTGAPSTAKGALEALRGQHPVVDDILEWRRLTKLKSSYADSLLDHVRPDGRIHPTIRLDGAGTGRTSCREPNLQTIPRGDNAEAKIARNCFTAPPGYVMMQFDYSQLELRIAAMLSGDPVMRQIFLDGVDYHTKTAQLISKIAWGIDPSQVVKKHRSAAKTVNFGIIYRMTAHGLAARIGCSVDEAETILDAVMGQFSVFSRWAENQIATAKRTGYSHTYWGGQQARRRPLWKIADQDDRARANAENAAVNTPVQGTASDYCLASLVEVVNWLKEDAVPAKCVLAIHDALLFEVREDCVDELAYTVPALMTQWPSDGPAGEVPLVVDCEIGPAWGSLEKYDLAA